VTDCDHGIALHVLTYRTQVMDSPFSCCANRNGDAPSISIDAYPDVMVESDLPDKGSPLPANPVARDKARKSMERASMKPPEWVPGPSGGFQFDAAPSPRVCAMMHA